MKQKNAINIAFCQSIAYLIIGLFLGYMPWSEHRYILMFILLVLIIGAHYIAKYMFKEME